MRKIVLSLLVLFFLISERSFAQGIDFKHISYEEALSLSKEQNKLIFIDFYTQWCGPCKRLAKGPFLEKEVGDFYNSNFISLKLDAEREGLDAARIHKVVSYPTLLFIDGNGTLVFKGYGRDGESLIASAQEALDALVSDYTLEKLNQEFEKRQNDEKFLKFYLSKAKDFGVNPSKGIEAWLKVQTEIEESSQEMMHYILDNRNYLTVGGEAEVIVEENIGTWRENCNDREKRLVDFLMHSLLINTRKQAYRLNNPELLQSYIQGMSKLPDDSRKKKDVTVDVLKYYLMTGDNDSFRRNAEFFVDSVMQNIGVKSIHQEDKKNYDKYKSANENDTTAFVQVMLELYRLGLSATKEVKPIVEIAHDYLKIAGNKSHYKTLNKWIKFCYELVPEYYLVDNLKANMLYKSGKSEKAIALKKQALSKYPITEKKRIHQKNELEQMINGELLFGKE